MKFLLFAFGMFASLHCDDCPSGFTEKGNDCEVNCEDDYWNPLPSVSEADCKSDCHSNDECDKVCNNADTTIEGYRHYWKFRDNVCKVSCDGLLFWKDDICFYYPFDEGKKGYADSVISNKNDGFWADCTQQDKPCKTIDQIKWNLRYNTDMYLAASDVPYVFTPPANVSSKIKNDNTSVGNIGEKGTNKKTYFHIIGDSKTNTTISVKAGNYEKIIVSGVIIDYVVSFVGNPNTEFSITNITISLDGLPAVSDVQVRMLWIRHDGNVTFSDVIITGDGKNFPKHLFEHSGGILTLINTAITPSGSVSGNIVFWDGEGSENFHTGQWTFTNITVANFEYTYPGSLFEEVRHQGCIISVNFTNSVFDNINWTISTALGGRFVNADSGPMGLVYTVTENNKGQVVIRDTTFSKLDTHRVPLSAPVAIVSVPKVDGSTPLIPIIESVTFDSNIGGGAGAIISNVDYSITGTSTFTNNSKADSDGGNKVTNDVGSPPGTTIKVDVPEGTTLTGDEGTTINELGGGGGGNPFPQWALIVIIAVGAVVVVAVVVVIIVCAVYYRKKKYQELADDEDYNESSSSSLRSTERFNEMDSI